MKVFLRQWEAQLTWNWCGEVTGFYTDLCFRETKEAKPETQWNLTLRPGTWPTHMNSNYSRGQLAAQCGWSGRRMPIDMKGISLQVREVDCPPTYGNSRFLGFWGPGRGERRISVSLLIDRGVELKGLIHQLEINVILFISATHTHARKNSSEKMG